MLIETFYKKNLTQKINKYLKNRKCLLLHIKA